MCNVTFLFRTKGHVSYPEVGCLATVQALRQTAPAACAGVLPARRLRVPPSYPRVLLRASRVLVLTRKVTSRLASLYPLSSPNSVCFFFFFLSFFLFIASSWLVLRSQMIDTTHGRKGDAVEGSSPSTCVRAGLNMDVGDWCDGADQWDWER